MCAPSNLREFARAGTIVLVRASLRSLSGGKSRDYSQFFVVKYGVERLIKVLFGDYYRGEHIGGHSGGM